MKTKISVGIVVLASILAGYRFHAAQQVGSRTGFARKAQSVLTDPAVFRSGLVEMVRQTANHDGVQYEHHRKLFEATGPWGRILAERDAIIREGLGDGYKGHPQLQALEVEVLYNLGKLDVVRNYEAFQKVRSGK